MTGGQIQSDPESAVRPTFKYVTKVKPRARAGVTLLPTLPSVPAFAS